MQTPVLERLLVRAGLRPTRKRLHLARLLFDGPDQHVTAEDLMQAVQESGHAVSLATVYNTLNQFSAAGLLRRISLDGTKTFFDTNTADHHHIYHEDEDKLVDVAGGRIQINGLPRLAKGDKVKSVEVMIRVNSEGEFNKN